MTLVTTLIFERAVTCRTVNPVVVFILMNMSTEMTRMIASMFGLPVETTFTFGAEMRAC